MFGRISRLVLAGFLLLAGCTNRIVPPDDVVEPARVGVLDHGRHSSLIVETADGMTRYAYGDWGWYAIDQTGAFEGSAALLWPTPAGLGRKDLPGPFSPPAVAQGVRVPIEDAVYLTVEAGRVRRLVAHLEQIFEENASTRLVNRAYDLTFVRHPQPYWLLHNSNQMVKTWLQELGCTVEGAAIRSSWVLAQSSPPDEP